MSTPAETKPGRLTDSKWWFCEIGQHDKCTVEIELSSRFEGCPCECHQEAAPQPAPDAGGEWSEPYYVRGQGWLIADKAGAIAQVRNEAIAIRIVADHCLAASVPKLVEALNRAAKLASLVTVRQVIDAGDSYIEAAGLNPYCMNEGLATGDERIDVKFVEAALASAQIQEKQ